MDKFLKPISQDLKVQAGLSDTHLEKIEAMVLKGSFDNDISVSVKNGHGTASASKTTFGITMEGHFEIKSPDNGTWTLVVKDGNHTIINKSGVKKGEQIPFKYHTGFRTSMHFDATWSEKKDTTLIIHVKGKY